MNYSSRIAAVIARLENHPNIEIIRIEKREGVDLREIQPKLAAIEKKYNQKIPSQMLDFYQEMNGFCIEWQPKPDMTVEGNAWSMPTCYSEFLPLQYVLIQREEEVFWENYTPLATAFQFFINYEMEMQGCWLLGQNDGTNALYYISNQEEDVRKLSLNFEQFFDYWETTAGCWGWLDAILPPIPGLQDTHRTTFQQWMPVLFPG